MIGLVLLHCGDGGRIPIAIRIGGQVVLANERLLNLGDAIRLDGLLAAHATGLRCRIAKACAELVQMLRVAWRECGAQTQQMPAAREGPWKSEAAKLARNENTQLPPNKYEDLAGTLRSSLTKCMHCGKGKTNSRPRLPGLLWNRRRQRKSTQPAPFQKAL